jgi:hypothetical protein
VGALAVVVVVNEGTEILYGKRSFKNSSFFTTIIVILLSQVFLSLVLLLSHWWTPPLRLQVSACSTFLVICDVPSGVVVVFFFWGGGCRESIECCPVVVSRYFVILYLQFCWPEWLSVWQSISCSTFTEFLYSDFCILIYFHPPKAAIHILICNFWVWWS